MASCLTGEHESLERELLHQPISNRKMPRQSRSSQTCPVRTRSQSLVHFSRTGPSDFTSFPSLLSSFIPFPNHLFFPLKSPMLPSSFLSAFKYMHNTPIKRTFSNTFSYIIVSNTQTKHIVSARVVYQKRPQAHFYM